MAKHDLYAEVIESTRYRGTRILEVKKFDTKKDRDDFIDDYNREHLNFDGYTPEVYTIAQTTSYHTVMEYERSLLQDETFSK